MRHLIIDKLFNMYLNEQKALGKKRFTYSNRS
jgi:hypothetical protein